MLIGQRGFLHRCAGRAGRDLVTCSPGIAAHRGAIQPTVCTIHRHIAHMEQTGRTQASYFSGKVVNQIAKSITPRVDAKLERVAQSVPGLGPDSRVLDVGCGTGALIPHLQVGFVCSEPVCGNWDWMAQLGRIATALKFCFPNAGAGRERHSGRRRSCRDAGQAQGVFWVGAALGQ